MAWPLGAHFLLVLHLNKTPSRPSKNLISPPEHLSTPSIASSSSSTSIANQNTNRFDFLTILATRSNTTQQPIGVQILTVPHHDSTLRVFRSISFPSIHPTSSRSIHLFIQHLSPATGVKSRFTREQHLDRSISRKGSRLIPSVVDLFGPVDIHPHVTWRYSLRPIKDSPGSNKLKCILNSTSIPTTVE